MAAVAPFGGAAATAGRRSHQPPGLGACRSSLARGSDDLQGHHRRSRPQPHHRQRALYLDLRAGFCCGSSFALVSRIVFEPSGVPRAIGVGPGGHCRVLGRTGALARVSVHVARTGQASDGSHAGSHAKGSGPFLADDVDERQVGRFCKRRGAGRIAVELQHERDQSSVSALFSVPGRRAASSSRSWRRDRSSSSIPSCRQTRRRKARRRARWRRPVQEVPVTGAAVLGVDPGHVPPARRRTPSHTVFLAAPTADRPARTAPRIMHARRRCRFMAEARTSRSPTRSIDRDRPCCPDGNPLASSR